MCYSILNLNTNHIISFIGDWGLGIGDWGLGIGGWGPIPNPQSPIPNPQSPIPNPQNFSILIIIYLLRKLILFQNEFFFIKKK